MQILGSLTCNFPVEFPVFTWIFLMTQQDHTEQRDCRHFLLLLNSPKPCDKMIMVLKNSLPGVEIKISCVRLKRDNLPSCLSDGLVCVTPLTEDWRLCAILDSSGTRCRRRMALNKYSSRPQMLCGMTATHVLLCASCQECTSIRQTYELEVIINIYLYVRGTLSTSGGIKK